MGLQCTPWCLMRRVLSSIVQQTAMQPYGTYVEVASDEARTSLEQEAMQQSYDEVDGIFVVPTESYLVQARGGYCLTS